MEAVRSELWRDHVVRSAEREVAEQWLRHLRSRLRFAFAEWQSLRSEREVFQHEMDQARETGDLRRVAMLKPLAEKARVADYDARRRYRLVADSVITEMCRVREVIISMNLNYLAQIRDLRMAIDTVDAALRLPLPPVTRPSSGPLSAEE
ncbi:hypothetical protein ACGFNU_03275 [Spirillospora sp. NPDC048911]|uniref:hypothetical protein n=1 Tax=Spirillospora sp. NPDC048911 TaxID=3364527 RepID=UPI003724AA3B